MREIGRRLGRATSTVSRELRRNAATRGGGLDYRATTAQWHADRCRPKPTKLAQRSLAHLCGGETCRGLGSSATGSWSNAPRASQCYCTFPRLAGMAKLRARRTASRDHSTVRPP
uniref:helix-turn-helix domain-containing protein n=1 Tax=Bradyrhizobium glycinis TaxID=2751812 RepID=UPI0035E33C18